MVLSRARGYPLANTPWGPGPGVAAPPTANQKRLKTTESDAGNRLASANGQSADNAAFQASGLKPGPVRIAIPALSAQTACFGNLRQWGLRVCTHKIAIGGSDLINVRIGPL